MLNRLHDKADGIDVLRFGARAQGAPRTPDRDVDVRPHRSFFHIAVAGPDVAQNGAQLAQIGPGFSRRGHVGPRHNFHQRHA